MKHDIDCSIRFTTNPPMYACRRCKKLLWETQFNEECPATVDGQLPAMKFCRDCAHSRGSSHFPEVGRLTHCVKSIHRCPVDGHEEMSLCYDARSPSGQCGPDARLFEEKQDDAG